jgi:hypothetical protein
MAPLRHFDFRPLRQGSRACRPAALALVLATLAFDAAAVEDVVLRFGWPDGLDLRGSTETRSATPASASVPDTHWHVVGVAPDGRRRIDVVMREASSAIGSAGEDRIGFDVDAAGALLGLRDRDAVDAAMRRAADRELAAVPNHTPETDAVVRRVYTADIVEGQLRATLWRIATRWHGVRLPPGGTVVRPGTAPQLGGEDTIDVTEHLALKRQLPCPRAGVQRACVEVELRWETTEEDEHVVRDRRAGMPDKRLSPVDGMHRSEVITLVAEPDGLVPHELRETSTVFVRGRDADGARERSEVTTSVMTFVWP